MRSLRTIATLTILIILAVLGSSTLRVSAGPVRDDDDAIVHVLNRIGYGPRPGDIERVRAIGLVSYIERQLHPERVADAGMAPRLATLKTLTMSGKEIADDYERPLLEARRERKQDAAADAKAARAKPDLPQHANLPLIELSAQKILRATYSDRQLEEVLTDFWFNHFNVDSRKGPVRFLLTEYERDTIRPHVLGRFRDLLGATAKSPAMLFYLDNWMSADPNGPHLPRHADVALKRRPDVPGVGLRRPPDVRAQTTKTPRGLNENYGRELLELHTLGVDGGYTQKDVTEVARAFTGWSLENPRAGGGFRFAPAVHDEGEKVVLGHRLAAGGGERDGEQVLDILASHPSTAHFIALELTRRFVSDDPPTELVDRTAATFRRTDGDLRAVMTTILTSPEFLDPQAYRAKVKTPFEFIVSALRATGAEVEDARGLVRALQQLGMPLYQCQPPTGYKDSGDAWMNTGALVNRMNIALEVASGRIVGTHVALGGPAEQLVAGGLSDATRDTIARANNPAQAAALSLGSPEFQRR